MLTLEEFKSIAKENDNWTEIDALFLELPANEQKRWMTDYTKLFAARVDGIPSHAANLDLTHIGFSMRLVDMGKVWNAHPYKKIRGKPDTCFENCFAMVNEYTSIYTGYGLTTGMAILPSGEVKTLRGWNPHAWLVNRDKKVIETTSQNPYFAYFGVRVEPEELYYLIREGAPADAPYVENGVEAGLYKYAGKTDFKMPKAIA